MRELNTFFGGDMEKIRAAIVGTGFAAEIHARALRELGFEVAAVVGSNLSRTSAFAEKWKIERHGVDFEIALQEGIDCVHICTPPALHYVMAKRAMESGKHVICEKPLCLDTAEAEKLLALSKEKGLVAAVNFNVRFHGKCHEARKLVAASEFGGVCLIHGAYLQEFHALPDRYSWRYKPELAGHMRAVTEIGSHWIDLARYLTGLEVTEVSADFGAFTRQRYLSGDEMYSEYREGSERITVNSEDAAAILLKFDSGAIGNVILSEVSHGRGNRLEIEVTGRNESVWWDSESPCELNRSRKSGGVLTSSDAFCGGFVDTFKECFREVYTDIERGRPSVKASYPTFEDGYRNTAVCSAIYESAVKGRWTKVELNPR
jgi:predicted dehydrogenase